MLLKKNGAGKGWEKNHLKVTIPIINKLKNWLGNLKIMGEGKINHFAISWDCSLEEYLKNTK